MWLPGDVYKAGSYPEGTAMSSSVVQPLCGQFWLRPFADLVRPAEAILFVMLPVPWYDKFIATGSVNRQTGSDRECTSGEMVKEIRKDFNKNRVYTSLVCDFSNPHRRTVNDTNSIAPDMLLHTWAEIDLHKATKEV
ncbi:hypothetical protein PR048_020917 [Dryococelus australis]|uniref:Uncharacterized protein n=1 Tax=Dryococelus australis TaxID=614101 RepID=A0ABQ9GWR9_9NEOP|nr:hypothetical protein PR048_020917 [Dryococelus australis]